MSVDVDRASSRLVSALNEKLAEAERASTQDRNTAA
jgi:hypothetical protein